ncbi:MAG: SusC/RagA family TonB-linked outer membrane protein [Phocaeicola sp.]
MLLLVLSTTGSLWANPSQEKMLSGIVVSSVDGEPLIGVGVQIEGTTLGTITDFDGKFSLSVSPNQTLLFSYIGYISQSVTVTTQTTLNISLKEDTETLDEVVVVGYGVQKKKLVTGATVQVKGENIARLNTNNPLQAMQGQTPGVSISSTSGQPGADMKVTIRGLGTVGNSGPLYLIDGVGGDISTLNPSDIESIDVLKDAASAAIYGAQAANGVVLITTKSGREGKAVVSFDGYYGIQSAARKVELLNAKQYQTIMDEQALNSGSSMYDWSSYKDAYDANGNLVDTNWMDAMLEDNAKTESYTLGITGGSASTTYALSLGYMSQEGIVGGSDVSNYERYNFRINSEHKLFKDLLKVGEQVSFVYKMNNGVDVGNQYNNTLRSAFAATPLTPIYAQDGSYYSTDNSDCWYDGDGNPYGQMMTYTNNENKAATFSGNVYAELQPIKNLKIRTVFGAVYGSSEYRSFSPIGKFSKYDTSHTYTRVSQNMNHSLGMTWTNTASYAFQLNEHAFDALLGMESYRYEGTYVGASSGYLKEGFDDWNHAFVNNGTATSQDNGLYANGNPHDLDRRVSYFGRLGWNFKETYMINATLRRDGSSKFARGNRWGMFPSVSAGWTLTNESFMKNTQSWLDFLKIRASWGQVGNQNISNYQYTAPIKTDHTYYIFGNQYGADAQSGYWGAYPSRLANENVKWETSEQLNVGIDARFLQSRLGLNADFYVKTTKDWLVQAPILATAGTAAPFINGGDVKNTGLELALTWNDRVGALNYNLGVNGAYNKNEVGNIPTEDGIIHGSTNQLYDNSPEFYRAENGHAIGYFWGYKTDGLFQNKQEIADWKAANKGILQADPQPGDVKYVDVNNDGIINDSDKVDLGNGMPDFTFGFNVGFDYKGFDFSMVASGMVGNKIVQSYRNHANKVANYTTEILDRWTGEGTSNKIPRVTDTNINWQFSDLYVHNGDFLRISNITVGYDFAKLIGIRAISQARFYAQVQNAFTFTKYNGMDPEIGYGTDGWVSGVDLGYYPRPRTILFGVNLKF